jgi:thiamine biosynthesis lipoprotein
MGTVVVAIGPDRAGLDATRRLFARVERLASRFDPASELSAVNRSRETRVELSPTLAKIVRVAADLRGRTGGLVDAGIGGAVLAWGYDRTFADLGDRPRPADDVGKADRWAMEGDVLVRADAGTKIDLGGVAKGWTCDLAVDKGMAGIVNAGGDVRSRDPEAEVDVETPWGDVAATLPIGVGGLATSSVTRRRWRAGGDEAHHLIDPRSMAPARTPVLSATAMAATAAEAEAGAKAVLILGADGLEWADRQPWLRGALVTWADGTVYGTRRGIAA